MTQLSFSNTLSSSLAGRTHLLIAGPQRRLGPKLFRTLLSGPSAALAAALAKATEPGLLGTTASSLVGPQGLRITVGVLPDQGSRYNAPARAEAIRKVVAESKVGRAEKGLALLVLDHEDHVLPAVNAVARAVSLFTMKTAPSKRTALRVIATDRTGSTLKISKVAQETAHASREAARLVDIPPADLTPAALAVEARRLLRGIGTVRIREIKGNALLEQGLGGIHGVGRCALVAPRLLVASYSPTRARGPHIALVGKGITYDTGGLHLKARGAMEGMKGDMGGAAAVIGAFRVLVSTGHKGKVSLVLCLAENAIGAAAYKPDDVLTMHSGKTVEINNTDAEGRLVLADGVSYAARRLGAEIVLDAATLTGAQMISTGLLHSACFSNDKGIEKALVVAGTRSGDLTHPMPFAPEFYKSEFESPIADMRNSVKNRSNAQSSCAAQFIYWHIEDTDVRWGHVDMAGPACRADRGTGYGVALLAETVRSLTAQL